MQPRFLEECLAGLCQQRDKRFEVIVVENGCRQPGTPQLVQDFNVGMNVGYLFNSEPGANRARNLGAQVARLDTLAFLDDDCVASPKWIESILANESVRRGVNVGGGPVDLRYLEKPPGWFQGVFRESLSEVKLGPGERLLSGTEYLVSANMFVSSETFRRFGGFEGKLGICGRHGPQLGNDEIEFIRRLARGGVRPRYFPRTTVAHIIPPERMNLGRISTRRYGQGISDVALMLHERPATNVMKLYDELRTAHSNDAWLARLASETEDLAEDDAARFKRNNRIVRAAYFSGLARGVLEFSRTAQPGHGFDGWIAGSAFGSKQTVS